MVSSMPNGDTPQPSDANSELVYLHIEVVKEESMQHCEASCFETGHQITPMLNSIVPQSENEANEFKGAVADSENLHQKIVHKYNDCNMSALKFSDKEKTNCKNIKSNIGYLMATKEKDKEKQFCCKVCDKSFKKKSNLNSHSRTHTREQPYQCRICCKSFSENSVLQRHMKNPHWRAPLSMSGLLQIIFTTPQSAVSYESPHWRAHLSMRFLLQIIFTK
ncbi:unnamed protein product [Clavelina lepadiformis]|uniref:C2H2-type domain-containing protein n=1 Tax=Clavelina lepadiformis TaxID=159417 RepID=A0ABP0G352_CLALP